MTERKLKLALAGYYGMQNFGDDLFALIGFKGAEQFWSQHSAVITSPVIEGLQANYSVKNSFSAKNFHERSIAGKVSRLIETSKAAFISDRYIYCGGSLFSEGSVGARRYTDRIAGARLSAIGVSIGPFTSLNAENRVRSSLKKVEFLAVRDRRSYEIAKGFALDGVIVQAADLAGMALNYIQADKSLILLDQPKKCNELKPLKIGLSLCNYGAISSEEQVNFCSRLIAAIVRLNAERPLEVIVININAHGSVGDEKLNKTALQNLLEKKISTKFFCHSQLGVEKTFKLIASLDMYATARLHGAIAAYVAGVPMLIHQHHQKLVDFADDIRLEEHQRYTSQANIFNSFQKMIKCDSSSQKSLTEFAKEAERNFTMAPWFKFQTDGQK